MISQTNDKTYDSLFGSYGFLNKEALSPPLLRLCDCGIEERFQESYSFDNNNRSPYSGYLFQYTLSGYGEFCIGNDIYRLEPGMAFFIEFPHNSSYRCPKKQEQPWTFYYLHFEGIHARAFFDKIHEFLGPILTLSPNTGTLTQFMDAFINLRSGKTYEPFESGIFLYQFLSTLLQELTLPAPSTHPLIAQMIHWIEAHYGTQENLSDLANHLGLSVSHISRVFSAHQGISLIDYLTQVRLEHALTLLHHKQLTVEEIALRCGFSCGNYFTKVFKRHIGMTPNHYRRQSP